MSKCNLLAPVQNLTGTFFTFSQYTQDLTKQYSQSDQYRCIPSKFAAVNLDLSNLEGTTVAQKSAELGEIFQNYFENACTFLRTQTDTFEWAPTYSRALLFQTLEKFGLITVAEENNNLYSTNVKYIGDINIYSNQELEDGVGYNEIYCYIPNDAKEHKYLFTEVTPSVFCNYPYSSTNPYIMGYSGTSWNGLSWRIDVTSGSTAEIKYADKDASNNVCYSAGKYIDRSSGVVDVTASVPDTLLELPVDSNDITVTSNVFTSNAIILFYDIVSHDADEDTILYKNIPLGIYFTGTPTDATPSLLTNSINKYVSSDDAYNQGTSYGLRVCSRFLAMPNNTLTITTDVETLSGIADIAPLLEKMGEVIESAQKVVDEDTKTYQLVKEHLDMFKNNNTNVPYVRELGTKKYWFVNGKNTGAIAQYEMSGIDDIVAAVLAVVSQTYYNKTAMNAILSNYSTTAQINTLLNSYYTKSEVDAKFTALEERLKIHPTE